MNEAPKPIYIGLPGCESWYAAEDIEHFSTINHDFRWSEDETMFCPIPLLWWDDASYIRYQCGEPPDDPNEDVFLPTATIEPLPNVDSEDDIPF